MTTKEQMLMTSTSTGSLNNADDTRRLLIITANSGTVYVNFNSAAATSSVFGIKLAAGESYTIKNYGGVCTANSGADVKYVSFS